jgi:hypothetical protein
MGPYDSSMQNEKTIVITEHLKTIIIEEAQTDGRIT